jgi:hypothetical protein
MAALTAMAFVGMAASIYGTYQQSEALKSKATFDKTQADINAKVSMAAADDAIVRGEKDAAKIKTDARRLTGAQRAAMAASGINPDEGSGLDIQSDTAALSAADALTVRNNAWREAWGLRVQAANYTAGGQFASSAGNNAARASIISGGLQTAQYGLKAGYHWNRGE